MDSNALGYCKAQCPWAYQISFSNNHFFQVDNYVLQSGAAENNLADYDDKKVEIYKLC